ncbi:hypothetical protein UYSO10_0137 [Kosakonia radicincitans]|nr:hypothetical protein UYSO10_0137 [Kosakonia radicincitans]
MISPESVYFRRGDIALREVSGNARFKQLKVCSKRSQN